SWLDRLEQEPGLSADHIGLLKERARPGVTAQAGIAHMKDGLLVAQQALDGRREETLAAQSIDPDRLLEIARFASSTAFAR
ncbi:hypothetical protein, partial [Klebsiella aerogenes]|uniref:hypothetical protein n=1 Tax=Klebsiella aerogenes TaxID=548 RepID=UPI0013CF4663